MKILALCALVLAGGSAFACVDISGTYLIASQVYVQYQQKACESLTESWCKDSGETCGVDAYTWTLDGTMVQNGGNPANWALIAPDGNSLHRTQLWDTGTLKDGHQCWWREQWYAKNSNGDLQVTYKLDCLDGAGKHVPESATEIWAKVH